MCVFLYFLLLLLSVYFSCFQCSWFSVSSPVFFPDAPSSFFGLLYSWFCHLYFWNPPFFLHKSAFHPYENVRSSFMGHILNQLYFTSAWLLVTLVTLSKTVNPLAEKPLSVLFNLGAVHTNPEKINAVSKMSRFVWTWPLGPVYKEGG